MSARATAVRLAAAVPAAVGRPIVGLAVHTGRAGALFTSSLYWIFVGPWRERTEHARHLPGLLVQVGNRSFGIVALVAMLVGATLVLQTGYILDRYGQAELVSGLVGITLTRELGPLMAAILVVARVGSAFTAGIGSMRLSEEILALETMGISPVGWLVAPRLMAVTVMMPVLTIYANALGILGGMIVATISFPITPLQYLLDTADMIVLKDIVSGLVKAVFFGMIITTISCHMGLEVRGGPEGLARNTMLSVVACLIAVIFTDTLFTGILTRFVP
jgi:phospholipid/cholesterol/gamma-HCH transport system permease protein